MHLRCLMTVCRLARRVLEEGAEYAKGAIQTAVEHLDNVAGRFTCLLEREDEPIHGIAGGTDAMAEVRRATRAFCGLGQDCPPTLIGAALPSMCLACWV